jgi:hypothetical protein
VLNLYYQNSQNFLYKTTHKVSDKMPDLTGPIVAAIVGSAVGDALNDSDVARRLARIEEVITDLKRDSKEISSYFRQLNLPERVETIRVPGSTENEIALPDRYGRRYGLLFVPPGSTGVTINVIGLGALSLTLVAGWNDLGFAERSTIKMTSGSAVTMLWRASNIPAGVTLVSV